MQAANAASVLFNPLSYYIGVGLTILSAAFGVAAGKKNKEAKNSRAKYQSHKQGVEMTIRHMKAENAVQGNEFDKKLYENIAMTRERSCI